MTITRLLTPVPKDADSTREFKQSLRLENGLRAKMNVLVNAVKRTNTMSGEQRQMMRDAIRNSVQRVWVVGAQYAANFLNRDFIMTQTDIDNIKALSNEFGDRMQWRIDNYVLNRPEDKSEIKTDFITSTFAGYVSPRTLSVAIREKSRQMLVPNQGSAFASSISSASAAEADNNEEPHIVLRWTITDDDKTCPVCSTLDGTLFELDDPDIPEPASDDIHPNCRCQLRLVEAEFQ